MLKESTLLPITKHIETDTHCITAKQDRAKLNQT